MWGFTKAVVLVYVAVALCEAAVLPHKLPGIETIFLGTVDGKSYFADDSAPRNWNAAKAFCSGIGMRLASIETVAQKDFLAGVENTRFLGYYWTAGRDALSTQQFVWDHNSVSVSENFDNDSFGYYTIARACVLFKRKPDGVSYQSHPCVNPSTVKGDFGALCESI